jgi:cytochrome c553
MKHIACMLLALVSLPLAAQQPQTASDELRDVLRVEPVLRDGVQVFKACVACHGRDGNGTPNGNVPVIAEQHQRVIAKQLVDYRHADRWDVNMEEVVGRHNLAGPRDIGDVSAYIASLPRTAQPGFGDGRNVALGKSRYMHDCQSCHGVDGEGNGITQVPRLAGQHYRYLLRQLHDTLEERRPNMPPPHRALLDGLGVDELTGLADYLARLQPPRHVVH